MRLKTTMILLSLVLSTISILGAGDYLNTSFGVDAAPPNDPIFGTDGSDTTATTGDDFDFSIAVTDNGTIASVTVEYWYGTGAHSNDTMSGTGPYTLTITIPSDSTDTLHYIFWATDDEGNVTSTTQVDVTVTDNDAPVFDIDDTPSTGTTGETVTLSTDVLDASSVTVYAEYWFGTGTHSNMTMTGTSTFTLDVSVPSGSTDDLNYFFSAVDSLSMWSNTSQKTVTITDNDKPAFGTDTSDTSATTGEQFDFAITASDNIGVKDVHVEYWFDSGTPTNTTMTGSYSLSITMANDAKTFQYIFHAEDDAGNWAETVQVDIDIVDDEDPAFGTDGSDTAGTTGDHFDFSIVVTDNVEVDSVYVEYWFGTDTPTNTSMSGTGPYTYQITTPSDRLDDLHYIFHAVDHGGHWIHTSQVDVDITDNDGPEFFDSTPAFATTGESITFSVAITDNIGFVSASLEYWFGTDTPTNVSLTGSSPFTYIVSIPLNSLDKLHYIFHANDVTGIWTETPQKTVTILDNDKPVFGTDASDTAGTTGEEFDFSIGVTDNIGLIVVYVEFWWGNGPHSINILSESSGTYTLTVDLRTDTDETFHYFFQAADTSGNWARSSTVDITITDNDKPSIDSDDTPSSGTTGDSFTFSIDASDNVAMGNAYVLYWFGTGSMTNSTMLEDSGTYTYTITLPEDSIDSLYYTIQIVDAAGLWTYLGSDVEVKITDNDKPVFGADTTDVGGTTGETLDFGIEVTDNMGVNEVEVEYWYGAGSHTTAAMSGTGPYTYTITVPDDSIDTLHYIFHAYDEEGNMESTSQADVGITDNDRPVFGTDSSVTQCTTGEYIDLEIEIMDNIGVYQVFVEYWYGSGERMNRSMTGTGPYYYTTQVPMGMIDSFRYIFHAVDEEGNWEETAMVSIPIFDNDRPLFGHDLSDVSGTTGDQISLAIEVEDNIGVTEVYVEYWFGSGTHSNVSMTGTGPYYYNITPASDSLETLYYIFRAADAAGNWNVVEIEDVKITDNDHPVLGTDSTPSMTTTGGEVTFSVEVTDNIGVTLVNVEYWFGLGFHVTREMTGTGTYSYTIDIPENSNDTLYYKFHTSDIAGNEFESNTRMVTVKDNDPPIIGEDLSSNSCTTGNDFTFRIEVTDNIEVKEVHVEYWFNSGPRTTVPMEVDGVYSHTFQIPTAMTGDLIYMFMTQDTAGNWVNTTMTNITVVDDDFPILISDRTPASATTGEDLEFIVTYSDNVGITSAYAEFWFGTGTRQTADFDLETGDLSIPIPSGSTSTLHYILHFMDAGGNTLVTNQRDVKIIDNDLPQVLSDSSPVEANTGEEIKFSFELTDNVRVASAILEYWTGSSSKHFMSPLVQVNGSYTLDYMVATDSVSDINYILIVEDPSGNELILERRTIDVFDGISPVIEDIDDVTIYLGRLIDIKAVATDNIGIVSYDWDGAPIENDMDMLQGTPIASGTYDVTVTVMDQAGNSAETSFTITVLPLDNDRDSDGVPDLVEIENDMDPDDPGDVNEDPDGDGIPSGTEIEEGLNPQSQDSDGDSMPDNWERDNDLDPTTFSSEEDTDGDGITDLKEFLQGTDPQSKEEEESDPEVIYWILFVIGVIIFIALVVFFLLRMDPTKKKEEEMKD